MIVLRGERAPSLNGMYAGMHYRKRMKLATAAHWLVKAAFDPRWLPFDCRVDIFVIATYRGTPVDSDNVVAKIYIDGLKAGENGNGVIRDDDRKHVRRVTTEAMLGKEDCVEIYITPVEE